MCILVGNHRDEGDRLDLHWEDMTTLELVRNIITGLLIGFLCVAVSAVFVILVNK